MSELAFLLLRALRATQRPSFTHGTIQTTSPLIQFNDLFL